MNQDDDKSNHNDSMKDNQTKTPENAAKSASAPGSDPAQDASEQPKFRKDKISKRRIARVYAMEILFSECFTKYSLEKSVEVFEYLDDPEMPRLPITQFTVDLVATTLQNLVKIDSELQKIIKNWRPDRLSIVDRTLLRLGAAEVLYFQDIPPKVTINEYIEIAKDYSEDDAPSFINGILDRLARNSSKL